MVITATDVTVAINGDVRWDVWDDITTCFFNNGTSGFVDETTDANNATTNDVQLPPAQTADPGDAIYFGSTNKFSLVQVKYDTQGNYSGGTSDWEYYNGTTWSSLTITDPTSKFSAVTGTYELVFTPPSDWEVTIVNTVEGFFIRLNYSVEATVVTTQPLGSEMELNIGDGSGPYTVLELHRFLQDLADADSSSGDDLLDITSATPSDRSTDNIITLNSPYNIDDAFAQHLFDGSILQDGGDEQYSGLVVVGAVFGTTTLQVIQNNKLYNGDTPFWGTGLNPVPADSILSQFLVRVRTGGSDIDGKRLRVFAREWGETFAEFSVTMGLGNSTAAIFTVEDLNNATAIGTVEGWSGITSTEGYQQVNLDNGDGDQPYYVMWDYLTYSVNQVYERTKWLTRRGTTETIHSIDGELFRGITLEIDYDNQDASEFFVEGETLTWSTGTGLIIADTEAGVDAGVTGTIWIQLLTGANPTDGLAIADETGCNADVNGTPTSRSLSPHIFGASTGSAVIGAYGVVVDPSDAGQNDKFFDLSNTLRIPPNNQDFTVYGLVDSEDYVLVTWDDTGIDFNQHTTTATYNAPGVTSIGVSPAIYADTPQTGTIRIELDDGRYRKIAYTSWTGSTFTIGSTDFTTPDDSTSGNNLFISYLDLLATGTSEAVTIKYTDDRTMFIRVRDGGGTPIKTSESTAIFNNAGGSSTATRIGDE